jgi:hypothetical protein
MRRGLLVFALLLATLAAVPAGAGAVTFGANLAREPNNTATCITAQTIPFAVPSCSVLSSNPTTGETSFPPLGEGIVSRVRVRVGPVTGPMQIAVEEALRKDNPTDPGHPFYACCKLVALSQVFTPAPNAITTIPVNFPVKQSPAPEESGYYVDDHLSLSMLNPNVPIPAALDPNASVGIWFPAWQSIGEERAGIYGTAGATVLFNADWDPVSGAAPNGAGATAPPGPVRLPLTVPDLVRIRNGQALLPLVCNLSQACRGLLQLQNRAAGAPRLLLGHTGSGDRHGKRKPKPITYASTGFSIPAGKKKTVKATLKKAGRRLLKQHPGAKVWLNVNLKGGGTVPPVKIALRQAQQQKKG